jgi:hypothetical protein
MLKRAPIFMGGNADEEAAGAGAEVAGAVVVTAAGAGAADVAAAGGAAVVGLDAVVVGLEEQPNTNTVINRIANTRVSFFIKLPPIFINLSKIPILPTNRGF